MAGAPSGSRTHNAAKPLEFELSEFAIPLQTHNSVKLEMNLNRNWLQIFLVRHRRGNCIFVWASPLHPPIHTFLPPEYSAAFLRSLNDDDTLAVYILMNVNDY